MDYKEREKRQELLTKQLMELDKELEEINEKEKAFKFSDKEFGDLQKQWVENYKKQMEILDEMSRLNHEILEESKQIYAQTKEMHKELEEAGFFEKAERYDEILENPEKYTKEEVEEAEKFYNGLNEAFIKYAQENPDGPIKVVFEDEE
ncbi:MAG: hypothetical protein E7566_02595 [Ruminococcaceae bacterium]|nr:hypothetical protein [Oscillospiraceae bacterium]